MPATPDMLVGAERAVRRALVTLEHMNSENTQEWDRTIATFGHARYELPDGTVHECTFIVHIAGPGLRIEMCSNRTGSPDIDLHVH